jgi:hypothetical protein
MSHSPRHASHASIAEPLDAGRLVLEVAHALEPALADNLVMERPIPDLSKLES